MTYPLTEVGTADLRKEIVDGMVKGFAEASYKFKQAVTIASSTAWKNTFFRETSTALTGTSTNAIKGIPRGAEFPQAYETWQKVSVIIQKYGLEANIPWEDIITDDVSVRERHLFRIAEGVAKAVDDQIWQDLTESLTPSNIQSFNISKTGGTGREWTESSAAIIDDLLRAKQLIAQYNYDTSNLMAFVSPRDYRAVMKYLTDKGAQFPSFSTDIAQNGRAGQLAGIQLVVSNSVTASWALVVVPQRCATWKALQPLQTTTKEDPYKSLTIRAVEVGVTELTDPKAVVAIYGTQGNNV